MATVAIAPQPNGAVGLMPQISTPSRLELSKPFTHQLRRIITNETDKLIKQRIELSEALLEEAKRCQNGSIRSDSPLRKDLLKLSDVLSRREAEHLRRRNKLIEKRRQLYRCGPSPAREIDLELLQALQWKFKRNLKSCLSDSDRLLPPKDVESNAATNRGNGNHKEMASAAHADSSSPGAKADSDKDGSHDDRPEGAQPGSISNLDGSFDDYARETSKKRKLADGPGDTKDKERRKQVKKERKTTNDSTTCLGSVSLPTLRSQEEEAPNPGFVADIDSMFQSKQKLKVNTKVECVKTEEADASETMTTSSSSDNISLIRTKGSKTKAAQTNSSTSKTSSIRNESLVEPWYKLHARAMMDPEFNDMVYYRPSRKRKRPQNDVYVHGAIPEPRDVVRRGWSLPTPPTSSPSLSPSCSSQSETGKFDKFRGKTNVRKRKGHHGHARQS